MLERWIAKRAEVMARELGYDRDKQEVLQYSMTILSTTILGFLAIFAVGSLVGVPGLALTAGLSGGILRAYSGGAHATAPNRCVTIGTVIFVSWGLAAKYLAGWVNPLILIVPTVVFGFAAIYRYAPDEAPGKPIQSILQRTTLRRTSFVLLGVWTIIIIILSQNNAMEMDEILLASTLGILWQSISLTPAGYSLMGFMDSILKRFSKDNWW